MPAARRQHVDLLVAAREAHCEPFLLLSAVLPLPGLTDDVGRNVVREPFLDLANLLDRLDAGFLVKLAQSGWPGIFAIVDAALGHLPHVVAIDVLRPFGAAADEGLAGAIDHHQTDAWAI